MSRNFSKVGVVLLLLLLLCGPVLQAFDCFNDAPSLDHDGLLHGVDALLCVALTLLGFSCLLLWFVKVLCLSSCLPRQLKVSFARLRSALFPPLNTPPLALRV
jgi:hypothetical protein